MAVTLLTELIMLFRPEASPRVTKEKYSTVTAFQMANEKSPISLKALFWTVISIMIGLIVGQL